MKPVRLFDTPRDQYFTVSNAMVDELMPVLSPTEFKVLMYLFRQICGYRDRSETLEARLSDAEIMDGTGIRSRTTIRKSVAVFVAMGMIEAESRDRTFKTDYRLNRNYVLNDEEIQKIEEWNASSNKTRSKNDRSKNDRVEEETRSKNDRVLGQKMTPTRSKNDTDQACSIQSTQTHKKHDDDAKSRTPGGTPSVVAFEAKTPYTPPALLEPLKALLEDAGTSAAFGSALLWAQREGIPPDLVPACRRWWFEVAMAGKPGATAMRPNQLPTEWPRFMAWYQARSPAEPQERKADPAEEARRRENAEKIRRMQEQITADLREAARSGHPP